MLKKRVASSLPGGYLNRMFRKPERAFPGIGAFPDAGGAALTRRGFLVLAALGATASVFPGVARAATRGGPSVRRLSLQNLHTGESLTTVYWERGEYLPAALEQIDVILRDHRTGDVQPMAPGLIDLVHRLTTRLGTRQPVQVVSGYRSPATNDLLRAGAPRTIAKKSLHLTGEAIDLRLGDRPLPRVREVALSLRAGGVGYYPKSGFIHLDVGRPRAW